MPLCSPPKKGDTPSPPADTSDGDVELSAARHQPEGLEELQAHTKFTKKELQSLYRGFKNVSTAGWGPPLAFGDTPIAGLPVAIALSSPRTVPAATWTRRPSRSSTRSSSRREVSRGCITPPPLKSIAHPPKTAPQKYPNPTGCSLTAPSPDSSAYAHFLFNAFDADGSGALCFEVSAAGGWHQGGWGCSAPCQPCESSDSTAGMRGRRSGRGCVWILVQRPPPKKTQPESPECPPSAAAGSGLRDAAARPGCAIKNSH